MENIEKTTMKLSEVKFNQDIYPRKTHNASKVQEYMENIESIEACGNFIHVASDGTLLDGRHRHLAYLKIHDGKDDPEIPVLKHDISGQKEMFVKSIELNSSHGQQLSKQDKENNAIALYGTYRYPVDEIAKIVSARAQLVRDWTKVIRENEERKENENIFDMYMKCYTYKDISTKIGLSEAGVKDRIDKLVSTENVLGRNLWKLSKYDDDEFQVPIYNVWSFSKATNEVDHFGKSEQRIPDRLIYLYTQPFDIVVDPFAGGASTLDVCMKRLRRCWVGDRKPIIERENDIRKHDVVVDGLPEFNKRWSDVSLVYLDPPYWKQAEGQYSNDPTDLANMELPEFTEALTKVISDFASKMKAGSHIALLIQPTQWNAPGHEYTDHIMHVLFLLQEEKRLKVVNRVSCPYSSQQCMPQMVNYAKENKMLLVLSRELIIWEVLP